LLAATIARRTTATVATTGLGRRVTVAVRISATSVRVRHGRSVAPAHVLPQHVRAHLPAGHVLADPIYAGRMATEDDVRRIALSLPETIEKPWFNTPGFRVKDKGFLRIRAEAEGGLVVFVTDLEDKEALLASDTHKFFTTRHYDGYPVVLVNLAAVDVDELRELIVDSWRTKAPKSVLKKYGDHVD
jgi:hypothetical protein